MYFKWQFIPFIDTQEIIYKELMNKELTININIPVYQYTKHQYQNITENNNLTI